MKLNLILPAMAVALLAGGCSTTTQLATRSEPIPTYEEAAASKFVELNRQVISKLVAGFDPEPTRNAPVLVATIVNVNDMRRTAPLGRTLSEQYASHMASAGFNVKEMKLRGTVFVKEETGELLLSREIKEIARSHNATMVLVGTYSTAANFTFVSLKFIRTEDNRILRGYDYALPNDRDVTKLLQVTGVL